MGWICSAITVPSINETNIITLKTQTRFTWWKGTSGVWNSVPPSMCGSPWDGELRLVKTNTARSAIAKHCWLLSATGCLRCLYRNTKTNSRACKQRPWCKQWDPQHYCWETLPWIFSNTKLRLILLWAMAYIQIHGNAWKALILIKYLVFTFKIIF